MQTFQGILPVWKQKKKLLSEAVEHSLKLANLDFASILTGFCLCLQPPSTGIIGAK